VPQHTRTSAERAKPLIPLAICFVVFAASASAQSHTLVALSHSDHTVNEVDPVSGKILHKFTADDQPHEGIASPDGKTFYAAVPNGPHVVILETAGFTETARIESPLFKS
jgi:DNA-binding beta-propeller fold protein YncE